MADRSMKFTLDFAAKTAGLKDAASMADKLAAELGDSEDAGKQMAVALRIAADKAEADLASATAMAEKLGQALGPEMAAKIGQGKIDELAVRFHAAGLSVDDVDKNVDELAASIRRLDEVSGKGTQGIRDGFANVSRETDNSRSVMANFAGNAVQELPGVGAAFGPLNMAIGQFTEYASEGNIKLAGMAATAGPIAGVAVAMELLSKHMASVAKRDTFRTDRVKSWAKVVNEAGDSAANLAAEIANVGKIDFAQDGLFGGVVDATDELLKAGVTVEDYTRLVMGSQVQLLAWADAQRAAGVDLVQLDRALVVLHQGMTDYDKAQVAAATSAEFFGNKAELAAAAVARGVRRQEEAQRDYTRAVIESRNETDKMRRALERDVSFQSLTQDILDTKTEIEGYTKAVADGSMTAEEASRRTRIAMDNQKLGVLEFGTAVLGLPPSKVTEILANVKGADDLQALIDKLIYLDELNRRMNQPGYWAADGMNTGRESAGPTGPQRANSQQAAADNADMGGGRGNTTVHVYLPPGSSPEDTVRAIKEYEARNGKGWRQ